MSFSETLSYGVLAGTSIYCIVYTPMHDHPLELVGYGIAAATALVGLLKSENGRLGNVRDWAEFCEKYTYPSLVGQLWLSYGEGLITGYGHPLFILLLELMSSDESEQRQVMRTGYSLIGVSCLYLANLKNNGNAIAASFVFFVTEVVLMYKDDGPLPGPEMLNYGFSLMIILFHQAYKHA